MKFEEIKSKTDWNNFLANYPTTANGIPRTTFIQMYEWSEFQEKNHKNSLKFQILNENGDIIGGGIGVIIKAKRGSYVYFRHGPLIDWSNSSMVNQTIQYIKDFCRKNDLWFARVSPLVEKDSKESEMIEKMHFVKCPMNDVEALDTWMLDVSHDEVDLMNMMKKNTRYLVKKAAKDSELSVVITEKSDHFEDFWDILEDTVKRQDWTPYSHNYVKNEFETFAKEGKASMVLVKYQNKFISAGIFLHSPNQSSYHYGASLTEYSKIPGSYRMIWEAIKLAKSKGSKYFNFWGVSPENNPKHPWFGLSQFKRKFPGFEQNWHESKDIVVSRKYWMTNVFEKIDKYRKGY